jgi:hypothetical protein
MSVKGYNKPAVVRDGQAFRVIRLDSSASARTAEKYVQAGKLRSKRPKRTGSAPRGIRTCSRVANDVR